MPPPAVQLSSGTRPPARRIARHLPRTGLLAPCEPLGMEGSTAPTMTSHTQAGGQLRTTQRGWLLLGPDEPAPGKAATRSEEFITKGWLVWGGTERRPTRS